MSFRIPMIPFEIVPNHVPEDWSEATLKIWEEIVAELCDENYLWKAHYKRHTYDTGCRGPLCRKFVRDASRSRPRGTKLYQPREDRVYEPVIDYFRIVATLQMEDQQLELQERMKGAAR